MENISEIYKNNKLIAEFMGYSNVLDETEDLMYYPDWFIPNPIKEKNNKNRPTSIELFRYHKSWKWLMPVVEKIESLGYFVKISTKMVSVARDNKGNNDSYLIKAQFGDNSKLQKTYNCVIETIKYINYLNNKNGK